MFEDKIGAYLSGAPHSAPLKEAIRTNIRLTLKIFEKENTLAYFVAALVTKKRPHNICISTSQTGHRFVKLF
jgi:hypothetical protein